MSFLRRLKRPDLVFQPTAAARRLRHGRRNLGPADVTLPWGSTITVPPDRIGRSIAITRVFDIWVTEVAFRLLEPGELAVDAGANIGYMTSLSASRVGSDGKVFAFEPHPAVFAILEQNVTRWQRDPALGPVEARRLAVSNRSGSGRLEVQPNFTRNMGRAALRDPSQESTPKDVEVPLSTLDELLEGQAVSLLKIDVEGHEHAVLEGARGLLAENRIRDIVFEEHEDYPTPSMTLLEEHGMTVLTVEHSLLGPRVHPVREGPAPGGWPGPNYLATREPDRATKLLRNRGWRCLRRS